MSYGVTFPVLVLLLSISFTGYFEVREERRLLSFHHIDGCISPLLHSVFFFFSSLKKWQTKLPLSVQWISGLSRRLSTRAALRLFVVSLCVLITLLMAILNFVSFCFTLNHFLLVIHHMQLLLSTSELCGFSFFLLSYSCQETTAPQLWTETRWRVSNSTLCL